jgi:hypothetical protein
VEKPGGKIPFNIHSLPCSRQQITISWTPRTMQISDVADKLICTSNAFLPQHGPDFCFPPYQGFSYYQGHFSDYQGQLFSSKKMRNEFSLGKTRR